MPWCKRDGIPVRYKWSYLSFVLTHWGQVTHICVSKLTIIGSNDGLSPSLRKTIIWTSAGILLIWIAGTNLSEILIDIHISSFKIMRLKISSVIYRSFCLGLNVLSHRRAIDTGCLRSQAMEIIVSIVQSIYCAITGPHSIKYPRWDTKGYVWTSSRPFQMERHWSFNELIKYIFGYNRSDI